MTPNSIYRPGRIIQSLTDNDLYKFNMQQCFLNQAQFAQDCVYKYKLRADEDLTPYIPQIKEELEHACKLLMTQAEIMHLQNMGWFSSGYIQFLRHFKLDFSTLQIYASIENGKNILNIEARGSAVDETHFEIIVMAIVSEVRNRALHPELTFQDVRKPLFDKIKMIKSAKKEFGLEGFSLADFGTRRRLSFLTQHTVVNQLTTEIPEFFVGTSNVYLAREHKVKAIGTQAHEIYQVFQQGNCKLKDSIKAAMEAWVTEFRGKLGYALTDIITFDAFLRDFDHFFAKLYDGLRHDSGCPFEWGEKAIRHYETLGIDPKTKVLIFSDGLNIQLCIKLWQHFHKYINVSFGVGTHLTNDVEGVKPLNQVMKLISVHGEPTAKISDSPGKTLCESPSFVAYLKETFKVAS